MKEEFYTHSPEETRALARKIAQNTPNGTVFSLDGDLGAGKTVFASGFAQGLGITESVSSPTFTIVQEYPYEKGMFYHLDLYRISDVHAGLAFGVDEFLDDPKGYALIEWPDRISGILPPDAIAVEIEHLSESERRISVC